MLCILLVVGGAVGAFFWSGANYNEARVVLAGTDGRLRDVQANLDQLRDETAHLLWEARHFESALSGVLATIGADSGPSAQGSADGDLGSIFNIRETPEGMLREVDDIRRLASYLSSVTEPIREIGAVIGSKNAILSDIPSIWPVAHGLGRVTMHFGHNRHPFSGQFYIHNGIDISTGRSGDAVIAAANGQVVTINNDPAGYGNYIIIRHRHGYYTRYAHLLSTRVRLGQRVQQGDTIGHIGNTGLSTGPHLHFEIIIGSDVVDPYQYMRIRSAWRGRR
ncbi:MAG: M23 family metallopeptidase [Treponema sp.]|nr:M23 family metallopeptidase [Treponema sp.]